MALGDYIRRTRQARGLSQRRLSLLSGISNSEISRIEAGTRQRVSPETLQRLSPPLGVSYSELMCEAGYISTSKGASAGSIVPPQTAPLTWEYALPSEILGFIKDEAARGWPYLRLAHGFSRQDLEPAELVAIVDAWVKAKKRFSKNDSRNR